MIESILFFTTKKELILKKVYEDSCDITDIMELVTKNLDMNFIQCQSNVIVYKRFDVLIVTFVVRDEDEMFILSLLNLMMSAMDKLLCDLTLNSFVYNFKDVMYAIDHFILDGKVINLDSLSISTAPHNIKSIKSDQQ